MKDSTQQSAADDPTRVIKTHLTKKLNYELIRNQTTVCKLYRVSQNATIADSKLTLEDFKKMDLLPLTQVLGPFMPVVHLSTTMPDSSYLLGTEVVNLGVHGHTHV